MTVDTSQYVPDFLIKINGLEFRHGTTIDVLSVSITETVNRADTFQFQLRARHAQLERFPSGGSLLWIDDKRFESNNKVEIEMGYRKNRAVQLIGKITGVSISFPESGVPTLSVQGQSLYNDLLRERRYQPFASQEDDDIVNEIATKFGLTAQIDPTNTRHATVSYKGATYAAILQERARRLNYEVAVKGTKLIFQRPTYLVNSSPSLKLIWGRSLKSFTPRLSTNNIATRVETRGSQTAQGGDKAPIVATVTADQVPARLGRTSGAQYVRQKFGENRVLTVDHRAESTDEARMMSRGRIEQDSLNLIQGSGAANGNPQLQSRTVIELQGLGERFTGNYYVTSTTHTIDGNGYQTTFEAKRDGI
jgi:phage protein D